MVGQPLPAHRTEVAQEAPGIAAVSSAILNEGASDNECEEDEQSDGTKHGSTCEERWCSGNFESEYRQTGREV
jgi:hypothetical protein